MKLGQHAEGHRRSNVMTYVEAFNAIEAAWWIALAILIAMKDLGVTALRGWPRAVLVIALMMFGVSDIIEIWTGAWWRPASLMLFKIVCIVAFIIAVVAITTRARRGRKTNEKLDADAISSESD